MQFKKLQMKRIKKKSTYCLFVVRVTMMTCDFLKLHWVITLSNVKEESYNATSKEDAKWNFDYWLQTEVETVGGKKDKLLKQWFAKTPYFYSDEENDRAIEED